MSRRYTAQEMRDMAEQILFTDDDWYADAGHMLLQAADMLDSKKKSKRRYEYTVKYTNGRRVWKSSHHYESIKLCKKDWPLEGRKFIRREVGEWEDVKDA